MARAILGVKIQKYYFFVFKIVPPILSELEPPENDVFFEILSKSWYKKFSTHFAIPDGRHGEKIKNELHAIWDIFSKSMTDNSSLKHFYGKVLE